MKLKDLKKKTAIDAVFANDPFEIYFTEDGKKKAKKKKKKAKEAKVGSQSFKESLKELSKKELASKAEKMGIDLDFVDRQDKKAMRKAILKAYKSKKQNEEIKSSVKMVGDKKEKKTSAALTMLDQNVPYLFDEKSRSFVIPNADITEDINCFNAMRSLGKLRKEKRKEDAFGTLMERFQELISKGALDEGKPEQVIDVEYTVVDETPKQEVIELNPDEVKQLDAALDEALAKTNSKSKKK